MNVTLSQNEYQRFWEIFNQGKDLTAEDKKFLCSLRWYLPRAFPECSRRFDPTKAGEKFWGAVYREWYTTYGWCTPPERFADVAEITVEFFF